MSDGYLRQRTFYADISGKLNVAAGTGDTTLVTVKARHTIFIQRIKIQVTTGAVGETWSLEDSAGTPVTVTGDLPVGTAPLSYELDYGPTGIPLTEAKNLVLDVSAAGAVGIITWDGYQKLTVVAGA